MRKNTDDLIGDALNYAVACWLGAKLQPNSIGAQHAYVDGVYIGGFVTNSGQCIAMPHDVFNPSSNRACGADIGERILEENLHALVRTGTGWLALAKDGGVGCGATMRVAGLRAVLRGHFGEAIEVPAWLHRPGV